MMDTSVMGLFLYINHCMCHKKSTILNYLSDYLQQYYVFTNIFLKKCAVFVKK